MRFYTVPEVAEATGYSEQTVRNWIRAGELKAIQGKERGAFKVAEWALRERQERLGLISPPTIPMLPDTPTRTVDPEEFLALRIEPALRELGIESVSQLIAMAEADPSLYASHADLLRDAGAYVRSRAQAAVMAV